MKEDFENRFFKNYSITTTKNVTEALKQTNLMFRNIILNSKILNSKILNSKILKIISKKNEEGF